MAKDWHVFSVLGKSYLYDVASGSLFELDDIGKMVLDKHNDQMFAYAVSDGLAKSEGEEREFWLEAEKWVLQGLFKMQREERSFTVDENEDLKALCLHVSHDCDLRCAYCFAGKGSFGGRREVMSLETSKAAVDFLLKNSGKRRNVEIDFFGGEPALNWEVVRETVLYGKDRATENGKRLNFTMTTNALALTEEMCRFLIEQEMGLVLSLDGRPEVHDRFRKTTAGTGSFEQVLPHIQKAVLLKQGRGYYVRGTYTSFNLDFAEDFRYLADQGFDEISLEPVVTSPKDVYAICEEHLPAIFKEYEKLAGIYLDYRKSGRSINFFHFNLNLAHGPCLPRRLAGCGAGSRYFAVTPQGELYPCHQFVGRDEYRMGTVKEGVTNGEMRRGMQQLDIYHKKGCSDCWARFLCSGGCHANAVSLNGDLTVPDKIGCAMMKKRMECALAVQAGLMGGDIKV